MNPISKKILESNQPRINHGVQSSHTNQFWCLEGIAQLNRSSSSSIHVLWELESLDLVWCE